MDERGFRKGYAKDLEGTDLLQKLVGDYTDVRFIISLNCTEMLHIYII